MMGVVQAERRSTAAADADIGHIGQAASLVCPGFLSPDHFNYIYDRH
jgi:hypothetical protein